MSGVTPAHGKGILMYIPDSLWQLVLDTLQDECSMVMNMRELKQLAYEEYGEYIDIVDSEGYVVESEYTVTRKGLQELVDSFIDGFDVINY